MRKSRFTEEQMLTVLREAESTSVAEAARKHQVSDASIYAWRKHFGQLELPTSSASRCWSSRPGRHEQVDLACRCGLCKPRACGLVGVAKSTLSYGNLRLHPAVRHEGRTITLVDQNVRQCVTVSDQIYILEPDCSKAGARSGDFTSGSSVRDLVTTWMDYKID